MDSAIVKITIDKDKFAGVDLLKVREGQYLLKSTEKSIDEIKAFTRSVLSQSYANELIESTFEGRYSAGGGVVTKARYIEYGEQWKVIKEGMTVFLKTNALAPHPAERAITTHPSVVQAVIRYFKKYGNVRI